MFAKLSKVFSRDSEDLQSFTRFEQFLIVSLFTTFQWVSKSFVGFEQVLKKVYSCFAKGGEGAGGCSRGFGSGLKCQRGFTCVSRCFTWFS